MATGGYPYLPPASPPGTLPPELAGDRGWLAMEAASRPRHRYWLHVLLLILTLFTTSVVGAGMAEKFVQAAPFEIDLNGYVQAFTDPGYLLQGLPFSLTLLGILLAHEFGHYLAARYYRVNATLPFFIPAPTLIGTMGAFIRIRSVILSKRVLFDIGIAGPLAGFAALLIPMIAGVSLSKIVPGAAAQGDIVFGTPLVLRAVEWLTFPGVPESDILLHPAARAAWAGLLATALNLLPIGQLDGGHILYALIGDRTKWLSRILVALLIPLGIFYAYSWLVWAALLFFFGMRHPSIVDPVPVGRTRARLAMLAFLILILSFTASPVRT